MTHATSSVLTPDERAAQKARKKTTPSYCRGRIEVLRRRAAFLRARIAAASDSGKDFSHDKSEASALEWAVAMLTPWFAKEDEPSVVDGGRIESPEAAVPSKSKT